MDTLNKEQIIELLPHREPMLLVDEIYDIVFTGPKWLHLKFAEKYEKKYHTIHLDEFDINYNINETLFDEFSEYQHIEVFNTKNLGNILSIDNDLQFGEFDEHKYHEMISNVPINYFQKDLYIFLIENDLGKYVSHY